jgi:ribulose-phosphate 3-epimerase
LSLNPDKGIDSVLPYLDQVDLVLLMSVFPGYSGQKFIPESLERAAKIRSFIDENKLNCEMEIDGGVNRTTAPQIIKSGIDIVVMGSAFFGDDNRPELVRYIKNL